MHACYMSWMASRKTISPTLTTSPATPSYRLGGRRLPVFSLRLDPPATGNHDLAQRIRMQSQQRYARPCDVVDAMIAQALKRSAPSMLSSRIKGSTKTEDD